MSQPGWMPLVSAPCPCYAVAWLTFSQMGLLSCSGLQCRGPRRPRDVARVRSSGLAPRKPETSALIAHARLVCTSGLQGGTTNAATHVSQRDNLTHAEIRTGRSARSDGAGGGASPRPAGEFRAQACPGAGDFTCEFAEPSERDDAETAAGGALGQGPKPRTPHRPLGRPYTGHRSRRGDDTMAVFAGMRLAPLRVSRWGRCSHRRRGLERSGRLETAKRGRARARAAVALLGYRAGGGAGVAAGWLCGGAGQLAVLGGTAGFVGGIYCTGPR